MPKLLTLNLHCYQESNQIQKFETIARAIAEENIDYVVLQEVAQHKDALEIENRHGLVIKSDNAAFLIVQELKKYGENYDFVWDWSHLGFQEWEEGVAILSKTSLQNFESKYISISSEKDFWLSRKVCRADVVLNNQTLTLISVHLGFWGNSEEPFENQFINLLQFAKSDNAAIVAGDFNIEAGTAAYEFVINQSNFRDLDLECNPAGMFAPTIGGVIDGWGGLDGNPKRIDYIFSNSEKIACKKADRIFTTDFYGEVSDHFGLVTEFDLLD